MPEVDAAAAVLEESEASIILEARSSDDHPSMASPTSGTDEGAAPTGLEVMAEFIAVSKALRTWSRSQVERSPRMTLGRVALLVGLHKVDRPIAMTELGAANDLSKRSMTVLIDGLEREGLVVRSRHPRDGRVRLVELSARGRDLVVTELIPAHGRASSLLEGLSVEDRRDLVRIFGTVAGLLAARGVETVPPFLDRRPPQ